MLFALSPAGAAEVPAGSARVVRVDSAYIRELATSLPAQHPGLRAAAARTTAARHATDAVRTWDDPSFTFGGVVASDRGPSLREDGNLVYGVDQKLPLFGRPAAARAQARSEAEAAAARQNLQFQLLRRDLAKVLYQLAYEERTVELGRQDLAWLETMAAIAEERYRAGGGSQVEVLRLQNERSRRTTSLRTDELHRNNSRLALNRLLGRDLHADLPRLALPEVADVVPYGTNLVEHAARSEPRLLVLARETAAAEAQVASTRKARLPDVSAGIEGRQYTGDGDFREGMFTVSLGLPWFNRGRYRSELARDRARLEATRLEAADQSLNVREQVHHLIVAIDAARRDAVVYRDEILPRSELALESSHANWLNNRGMFLEVMEARRMLVEARVLGAKALAEQHQALQELVLWCGLESIEDLARLQSFAAPQRPAP